MSLNQFGGAIRLILLCLLVIHLTGADWNCYASEKVLIKLATSVEPENPVGLGCKKFAEIAKKESGGNIDVEVHYSGVLGNESTALRNMLAGTVEMGGLSDSNMAPFTKAVYFLGLPFIFNDSIQARRVIDTEWVRSMMAADLQKSNMKPLMFFDNGGGRRIFTTSKQVKVPSDIAGLKIRIPNSPIESATFRAFGALPTPVAWGETYTALSQGTVDGEGIQYTWCESTKHMDVLKHCNSMEYVVTFHVYLMRNDYFQKLSKQGQEILLKAGKAAEAYQVDLDARAVSESKKTLSNKGIIIYEPTEQEKSLWVKAATPTVWEQFKADAPPELIEKIKALQAK